MAGRRGLEHALHLDLASQSIAPDHGLAGRSRQRVVPGALDSFEATVGALETQDVGGQLTIRIEAQWLGHEGQAGLAQGAHARRHGRRQAALEPHERALAHQRRVQLLLGHLHDRRQPRGDANGIAHGARLGEQGLGRTGSCQRRAVAVDDRAPLSLERDRSRVLPLGEGQQLARTDDLEIAQTRRHAPEGDDERRCQEQDTRAEQCHSHGWSGALMKSRAAGRLAVIRPPPSTAA